MPKKDINARDIDFKGVSCLGVLAKSPQKDNSNFLANKYKIPDFQRSYVWKSDQISRLIESISTKKGFYLGNIVILGATGGKDFIVDGQQRLVTISLLCKILEEKATKSSLKKEIRKLIISDDKPRIAFTNKTLDNAFRNVIFYGCSQKSINVANNNILSAIKYIKKNSVITSLNNDKEITDFVKKIKDVQFVVIKCLNAGEVYSLFEGLNSTGIVLTSIEKTKNGLLGKLNELGGESSFNRGRIIWNKIELQFEKTYPFWFNKFLRHHWFLINGKVGDKKLYDEIRKLKIKPAQTANDILEYIKLLKKDSDIYIKLRTGKLEEEYFPRHSRSNSSNDIVDVLKLFDNLEIEQVYPVLLALYNYAQINKQYYHNSRFFKDIKKLWAFSFLAKYGKVVPSNYENKFANLCKIIQEKRYSDFKIEVDKFFKDLTSVVSGIDSKFIRNFNMQYDHDRDKFTKFIFSDLYSREKEIKSYEIEHILPKGDNGGGNFKKWPNIDPVLYNNLKNYIQRLGNLTMIEKELNSKAEDLSFKDKIKIYKNSEFVENKKIKNYTKFGSKDPRLAVEKRGEDLAKDFFKFYMELLKQ